MKMSDVRSKGSHPVSLVCVVNSPGTQDISGVVLIGDDGFMQRGGCSCAQNA